MTVKQELQIESEKTPKKDLEKIKVGNFLKSLEETYKKIQNKFTPFLENKERIDMKIYGETYRCPKMKQEYDADLEKYIDKFSFQSPRQALSSTIPRRIVIKRKKDPSEIVSISFEWDKVDKNQDLFLKITADQGKVTSIERRTTPNTLIKLNDSDTVTFNQKMKIEEIDYPEREFKLILGYLVKPTVSFQYSEDSKNDKEEVLEGKGTATQPPLVAVFNRLKQIENNLFS